MSNTGFDVPGQEPDADEIAPDLDHEGTDLDEAYEQGGWLDPDREETSTHAEFDGDMGGLAPASRRALVVLMKNRFITARSHKAEFQALVRDQALIRARLNDMYLSLVIDTERDVAYKTQVVSETAGRFPTLLSSTSWGREETVLLVFLRAQIRASQASGRDRAFVERADLMDRLSEVNPHPDESAATRRGTSAIERLVSSGLLVGRMDADNFEIDPAVESLVSQRILETVLAWVTAVGQPTSDTEDIDTTNGTDTDPADQ